ncbi:FAD-dependent oxidoreductase [Corynebacterium alimapuense]|uniref:CoA-disulfide reductase n=1 Tax=Corynebacterium alimapuense TaxID=1576874 RepID=A0A3M8K761_9CORY|nr:FAD-dependent oxidoreductase [Corynebacterium alimapuense]RNE48970.1 CoA-disulfide reductase [Corynebacterium alimapuense]
MTSTVIVGGVAGGMSTAARLRRRDEHMEIVVIEASGYVSFANCGLPYHVSGVIPERDSLLLQTPESLHERFNLDVRVNHLVTAIDRKAQEVTIRNLLDGSESRVHYDNLVLSPGATPIMPPIPGIERALTLRTVEDVDKILAHLTDDITSVALIGGGFIGLELAENLHHRGLKVTIIERAEQIMAPLDPEMAAIVTDHLRSKGLTILTGADTAQIGDKGLSLASGEIIDADLVIAAIGVKPESTLAREAGLAIGERGGIKVDEQQRTSDPAIFALGDAAEKRDAVSGDDVLVPLAQTANRHGRLVADIITGRDVHRTATLGTSIVGLFDLAAGSVGWNEKRAALMGQPTRIIHVHPANHAGYYPGAETIHLKLVVNPETDAILGAQAVGAAGVDKRIDVIATAMRGGLTATDLADLELAYAPQFGSAKDPVNFAGFVNDNMVAGERTFQWNQVDEAINDGWTLVDVRTPAEFAEGTITGAINLPLDDLRERFGELESKKTLVFCRVGLRGHVATSLLTHLGIETANLDGGFMTWEYAQKMEG